MKYIIPTLLLVLLGCANNEEYAPSSSANVSTSPVKNYHGDNISGTKFSSPQTATTKSAEKWNQWLARLGLSSITFLVHSTRSF